MLDATPLRDRLVAERAELVAESARQRGDGAPETLDPARVGRLSRMDAMQVRAMAGATERRRQTRLRRIDAALQRIAEGAYGDCLECGEPIAERRLELDPAATHCIQCAEAAD